MKTRILALAFALALPLAASADVSYSYLDAGYQFGGDVDIGIGAVDTDGFALKGSYAVNDTVFVQFDYSALGTDPSGIDFTDWALSIGWHGEMAYAKFGVASEEVDVCGLFTPPCTIDDTGYAIDFGLRAMVTDALELNGHVGYSDLGDLDTYTNYGVGAVFMVGESMGISFNYDLRSGDGIDFTSYGIGARFNF